MVWQLPPMFGPCIFGRAVDEGIVPGDVDATLKWGALLLAVTLTGALFGILMHTYIVRTWLIALYGTMKLVTRKAAQMGHVLPAAYADRRGAERRLERLRRVRRADRDPGAHLHAAGRLPRGGVHRAEHLGRARRAAADRRARAGGGGLPAAQAAPPPPGGRARPQLRPDLAGHRHRRRPADPARHRRRAHLRQQLRRPVPAGPPGRPVGRHLAGRDRGRRRAVLRRVRGAAGVARHPPGDQRRPDHRPADQLPRLRAVHDLPDPDVLRVRPEAHPRAGLGPQGDRDLRAAAAVARGRRPRAPARARRPGRRADRLRGPRGPADHRGQRRARGHLRPGRPAGPLPADRHRARQPRHRRGPQGPRGPARPRRAGGRARPDRRARRGARPPARGA